MSTLEVSCARCDKRFRVRAEFAGKTTRCPGCSAPITIAGSKPAPVSRSEPEERPRPRTRPKDDDDERQRGPTGDWRPVAAALGREQVAVLFVLMTILCSYLVYCIGNATGPSEEGLVIGLMVLLLVGPSLVGGVFGLMARVSALGAPRESHVRGSAVPSMLCGLGAFACLVMFGLTLLAGLDRQRPSELAIQVSMIGLLGSTLAAIGTFLGFVAQVGIVHRSAEVSRAVGRMAAGTSVVVVVLLGIAIFYTLVTELTGANQTYYSGPHGGGSYRNDGPFYMVVVGVLLPIGVAVVLIMYHRLLAAARRAVLGETAERVND